MLVGFYRVSGFEVDNRNFQVKKESREMKRITFQKRDGLLVVSALLPLSLMICLLVLGTMPTESRAADKEYKIGLVASSKEECGQATIKAAKMASEEINSQGGVLGRKIAILFEDDEGSTEKGISALKKLVEKDRVDFIMGGVVSGITLAQMEYMRNYNMIYMATGVSSPLIADKVAKNYDKYKYVFRTTINSLGLAKSIVEDELALFVKLGYKRFAIMAEDAAWNRGLIDYLQKNIPSIGGSIVNTVIFDPSTIDFAPVFSKITSGKADVAVTLFAHTDTITLYKQYREMKPPFRMVGFNNPGMDANYWKKTGGACLSEVNIAWGPIVRTAITNKSIPFFDRYSKKFGGPPHACSTPVYDGVYILADAVKRANGVKTNDLIRSLEASDYIGVTGRMVFDKKTHDVVFGSAAYCPYLVTQWQDGGKFAVLLPKGISKSEYKNPPWLK
jgi:branched-chain amino acid transport system substrate-binding protein